MKQNGVATKKAKQLNGAVQKAAKPTKAAKGKAAAAAQLVEEEEEVNVVVPPAKLKKELAAKGKKAAAVVEELPVKAKKGKAPAQPPAKAAAPVAKKQNAAPVKNGKAPAAAASAKGKALKRSKVEEESEDDDDEEEEDDDSNDEEVEMDEDDSDDEQEQEQDDDDDDEEEEDDDDDDDDDEDENDNEAEVAADDSDAEEEDDDDAESDDAVKKPTKATKQQKKPASESKISEINFKFVPNGTPEENIVKVKNLPQLKSFKHMDLAGIFYKYGKITAIVVHPAPTGSIAYIVYENAKSAEAALAGNEKEKLGAQVLGVVPKTSKAKIEKPIDKIPFEDRQKLSVKVKNIDKSTTKQNLHEHFAECGSIVQVQPVVKVPKPFALICFESEESVEEALKLNGTELDGATIEVKTLAPIQAHKTYDADHTIMIINKENFTTYDEDKLRAIFEKFGTIENINVVCRKVILAFINFEEAEAATKALSLNGKTVNGLTLELKRFEATKNIKTTIVIENLHANATQDDIRTHFKDTGDIERITIRPGFTALVQFKDSDAFCKSFLQDESYLLGRIIFITPFSPKKKFMLKPYTPKPFGGAKKTFNNTAPFYRKGGPPTNKRAKMAA